MNEKCETVWLAPPSQILTFLPTAFSPTFKMLPFTRAPEIDDADAAEIALARRGDLGAFDVLVGRHQDRIFRYCLHLLGDRDEAGDAAQETFIRAFRFLHKFRGDCTFSTWLHRIALNVSRDALKRRSKAPRDFSSMKNEDDDLEFDPVDTNESRAPSFGVMQQEKQRAVRRALAQIPENFRAVLILYDLEGHSYENCAAMLQLPMGTVKSRLNRARAALKTALGDVRELFDLD